MANYYAKMTGVNIILEVRDQSGTLVDFSVASSMFIWFRDPKGRTKKQTADTVGLTLGRFKYTTSLPTDIGYPGDWQVQGEYTTSAGTYYTDPAPFPVLPTIF